MVNRKILLSILAAFLVLSCSILENLQGSEFGNYNPFGTNTPDSLNTQSVINPFSGTDTPVPTATPVYLTVSGVWRCRAEPNILSDTTAFLHDGEIVQLISTLDKWNKIMAGNVLCYVNRQAFK